MEIQKELSYYRDVGGVRLWVRSISLSITLVFIGNSTHLQNLKFFSAKTNSMNFRPKKQAMLHIYTT